MKAKWVSALTIVLAALTAAAEVTTTAPATKPTTAPTTKPTTAPTTRPAAKPAKKVTTAGKLAVAGKVAPSLVRVEYTLRVDKGDEPRAAGWQDYCAGYGGYYETDVASVIEEERPFEAAGYVLSPTQVLTTDLMIHPRFIKSIAVRSGDEVVLAKVQSYCLNQTALILALDKPLASARPLAFDAKAAKPYLMVNYAQVNGAWTVSVKGFSAVLATSRAGRAFRMTSSDGLVTDATGTPVAMIANGELPTDDSWKGSPLEWPALTAEQMAEALAGLQARFEKSVVRVALSFRSPKKDQEQAMSRSRYREEDDSTEKNVLGVVLDETRVLIVANYKPDLTARLERIVVHPGSGEAVEATFAATLKDYGAFLATLKTPQPAPAVTAGQKIDQWRNQLLLGAKFELQGENLTTYYSHRRIPAFYVGYRGRLFPELPADEESTLLYSRGGELIALPIFRRDTAGDDDEWSDEYATLTPASHLADFLYGDLAGHVDPNNVPLAEAEESRLAWLGTILQPLDRELARFNGVSHLTNDGSSGAMVSYVYADSPAAVAGVEPGDILIRLYAEGEPRPIEVRAREYNPYRGPCPWERWDELPESYYDRIPRPWEPAENELNRTLTEIGFGKKFDAELSREGQTRRVGFAVTQSPTHYDMAERAKSDWLGVTVRDMTYEVRRYFLRAEGDPGVIISKIAPGSKASVAGVKPFEVITHVNGQPVATAADFKKYVAAEGDLELAVKRMTKGRVVKIRR